LVSAHPLRYNWTSSIRNKDKNRLANCRSPHVAHRNLIKYSPIFSQNNYLFVVELLRYQRITITTDIFQSLANSPDLQCRWASYIFRGPERLVPQLALEGWGPRLRENQRIKKAYRSGSVKVFYSPFEG